MTGPQAALLPDGRRLHLQHGPIDIIAEADGPPAEVALSYHQAQAAFDDVLARLVEELAILRRPIGAHQPAVDGPVARRMAAACWPHRQDFLTPMTAVAGAVADYLLEKMAQGRALRRAYVNNGGDIALYLTPGEHWTTAIAANLDNPAVDATLRINCADPVRGIATSGWRGRSLSFGIADAVTVLAESAAAADVATTLIANRVTADHPAIDRRPADQVRDDTDLGQRPVTVNVGTLPPVVRAAALQRGSTAAEKMRGDGRIIAAYLALQSETRVVPSRPHLRAIA